MLSFVSMLMLFAGSQAQFTYMGSCPNDLPMKNFDSSQILGWWYEIERYANSYEENQKCSCINFIEGQNNQLTVEEVAVIVDSGAQTQWEGTATPLGDPSIAQFNLTFPQYSKFPMTNLLVLDTDYDRYAIIWLCQNMGEMSKAYVWIISRNIVLDEKILEHAHAVLGNHHVPTAPLIKIDHNNCPP